MKLTGEIRSTRGKTCPIATLSTTNPTWTDPGSIPCLRAERPATNRLSHGTADPLSVSSFLLNYHRFIFFLATLLRPRKWQAWIPPSPQNTYLSRFYASPFCVILYISLLHITILLHRNVGSGNLLCRQALWACWRGNSEQRPRAASSNPSVGLLSVALAWRSVLYVCTLVYEDAKWHFCMFQYLFEIHKC
jgi:hypothetical protein